MSLSGTWAFKYSPQSRWTTIQVPGEAAMQGFAIEHDKPFFYKKTFIIPADQAEPVFFRFDGVYSHAKLSVNGKFVREHHGGFTRWETDITSLVRVGKKNEIQLEVADRLDEISYASGYAHHPIGGKLRDVTNKMDNLGDSIKNAGQQSVTSGTLWCECGNPFGFTL